VKAQNAEEQVDRRLLPPHPHLPVAFCLLEGEPRDRDALRQRGEHVLDAVRADEHVDVEIARSARFERAVAERDRAADRMRYPRQLERVVHGEQTLAQLAHAASRINGG
jgi:hypothetical protein